MQLPNQNLLHYWDLYRPHLFNQYLSRIIYMIFGKSGSFEKSIKFMLKIFPLQLANQNLLQYWDLDEPELFNQYLDRRIFMIFGKSRSFEKSIKFMLKLGLFQFTIHNENVPKASQNILQYLDLHRAELFNQFLNSSTNMIFGKVDR